MRPARVAALLVVLSLAPALAGAVELVPGGYAYLGGGVAAREETTAPALVFTFTPRSAAYLAIGPDTAVRRSADRLALTMPLPTVPEEAAAGNGHGLLVGGAFETGGLVVGALYARPQVLGVPSDLIAADLRYGPLATRLGLVHQSETAADPYDILLFSTELAATPWLSLESDLALGRSEADRSVAAGRIGIRVDF